MSSFVVHNSPHIAITRSLSRRTYENFKLLKNLATTRRLKWEEPKLYRSRSALVDCRTDLVLMSCLLVCSRRLAKHCDKAGVVCELLRYNMILKPSSDELLRYDTILKPCSDELLREAYKLLRYVTILKMSLLRYFYEYPR